MEAQQSKQQQRWLKHNKLLFLLAKNRMVNGGQDIHQFKKQQKWLKHNK